MEITVLILAAGKGKRMKSSCPKVLHNLCGKPILFYVLDTAKSLKSKDIYVIVSHKKEKIIEVLPEGIKYIIQDKPLGTGHALQVASKEIKDLKGDLLILSGDVPLLQKKTILKFYKNFKEKESDIGFISFELDDPTGYGRVIRDKSGKVLNIKEEKDCNFDEKKIKEINSGIYLLKWERVKNLLPKLSNKNKQKEYYLTDLVSIGAKENLKITAECFTSSEEFWGINSLEELANLSKFLYKRKRNELMKSGVTIIDPENTYINLDVKIGKDTIIYPGVFIEKSKVGSGCTIYPNCFISNSKIDDGTIIYPYTVIEDSTIGKKCKVGPSAHLRPKTILKDEVRLGNFVETKKASLGKGTKAAHLSYLGDATIGENVNIGCGTITCNYDGIKKYQTIIEDGAFIGSDCQLVAPVKVGKNAYTASGTTITDNVPDWSLAVSRVPQKNIKDWVKRRRKK